MFIPCNQFSVREAFVYQIVHDIFNCCNISRALGAAFLVLHVVVAWALFLVAVRARWNT